MEIQLNDRKLSEYDDTTESNNTSSSEDLSNNLAGEREFLTKLLQLRNQEQNQSEHGRGGKSEFFKKLNEDSGKSPAPVRKAAPVRRVVQKPKGDGMNMKKSKPAVQAGVKGRAPGPPVSTTYNWILVFLLLRLYCVCR